MVSFFEKTGHNYLRKLFSASKNPKFGFTRQNFLAPQKARLTTDATSPKIIDDFLDILLPGGRFDELLCHKIPCKVHPDSYRESSSLSLNQTLNVSLEKNQDYKIIDKILVFKFVGTLNFERKGTKKPCFFMLALYLSTHFVRLFSCFLYLNN